MIPFATIIVPTFNQAQYLSQALDSLLAQTNRSWEAVVVNDGSTDNTAAIADGYAERDARIRVIHKQNGGVATALNVGLNHARGEWIHWLSSDDMFSADKLAINRHWIESVPNCNFFFSYFTLLTESTGKKERRGLWGPLPDAAHQILGLFHRNYISGISICVKRSVWKDVGFFNEELYYAQDYDQWLRLLAKNQGVFIPEWTVVSRNHELQGSETFPAACYFDTAKAAIKFINEHTFQELVPCADLTHPESATLAIASALDVACDRSSFIYCLGAHPGLVLRILEAVFSAEKWGREQRGQVRARIQEMALQESDDQEWSWMWRQLALSLAGQEGSFRYSQINPAELALRLYRTRQICKDSSLQPIRDYLKRFMTIDVPLLLPSESGSSRIVFFADGQAEMLSAINRAAQGLADIGYRPLILISNHRAEACSYDWNPCTPMVCIASLDHTTLPWLGGFDVAVSSTNDEIPAWAGAKQHVTWDTSASAEANLQKVLMSQSAIVGTGIRPVLFLERVLWGGGAERVVHEIASNLDRRRYKPVVLTLFEEHSNGMPLPECVETINVSKHLFGVVDEVVTSPLHGGVERFSTVRRLVRKSISLYRHFLSPELRHRIGIGRRIANVMAWMKSLRRGLRSLPSVLIAWLKSFRRGLRSEPFVKAPDTAASISPFDVDFVRAIAHHSASANCLAKVMQRFGKDAALITVMEEAAIAAWLAQASMKQPYIASLHTVESKCLSRLYPQIDRYRAEKWMFSAACEGAQVVVFPGVGCKSDLSENFGVPLQKIDVIWNPVDCVQIRRQSWQHLAKVSAWKRSAQTFRMVHVGRLDGEKNHDLLLQACCLLKQRGRNFSLAIIGKGAEQAHIIQRIQDLGLQSEVFLAGEQKNPFPWMAAADVLLLTSHFEAFALVLVEAMVCGTAVIATDCPTGPREILSGGDFGMLASNGDCNELVAAVEKLMDDELLKEKLVQRGYERAIHFDVKKIIPQWEDLIDSMPVNKAS